MAYSPKLFLIKIFHNLNPFRLLFNLLEGAGGVWTCPECGSEKYYKTTKGATQCANCPYRDHSTEI